MRTGDILRAPDGFDYRQIVSRLQELESQCVTSVHVNRGNAVLVQPSGLILADFNISGNVSGISVTDGKPGDLIRFISSGKVFQDDWTLITGVRHLIQGDIYFLSENGKLSNTLTTCRYLVKIGYALSPEELVLGMTLSVRL
jgi:hypothetical protein